MEKCLWPVSDWSFLGFHDIGETQSLSLCPEKCVSAGAVLCCPDIYTEFRQYAGLIETVSSQVSFCTSKLW